MMDLYRPIAVSTNERFALAVGDLPLHPAVSVDCGDMAVPLSGMRQLRSRIDGILETGKCHRTIWVTGQFDGRAELLGSCGRPEIVPQVMDK